MAFASISPAIIFLLAISGHTGNDIVSMLPAEDYFQSRKIEVTAEKMLELAAKDPVDAKTSIQQLLAMRLLAEDPAKAKKAEGFAEHLKILQDIAAGKKSQDKLGFSKEYAAWAVARLTDKQTPQPPPVKKLAENSINWFPTDVSFVLALDFTGETQFGQTKEARELVAAIAKQMPARDKTEIYDAVDEFGNVRIDRMAMGVTPRPKNRNERFYFRFTGKGDQELIAGFVLKNAGNLKSEKTKGPQNEPITILTGGPDVAFGMVGNSGFLIAIEDGQQGDGSRIKQMLEIRASEKPSVFKGILADELKKVSDKANGLIVSTLIPPELAREFGPPNGPFNSLPSAFVFEAERQKDGIDFRFQGKLATNDEAKAFIEDVLKLRGQAMIKMKLEKDSPIPFDGILKTLATMKLQAKDDTVSATMRLSNEVVVTYVNAFVKMVKEKPALK
jgi:hypothetical protein